MVFLLDEKERCYMKLSCFFKIIFIVSLIFISSCTLPKKQEIIIEDNVYQDKNPPSVIVEFPFNIKFFEKKVEHSEYQRHETTKLTTDYNGVFVYINKTNISNYSHSYTGADLSLRKNRIYEYESKNSSNCSVYIKEIQSIKYLFGDVIKHINDKTINQILLINRIGAMSDHYIDQWKLDNKEELNDFIEKLKIVCHNYI